MLAPRLVILLGVLSVSTSSILFRLAAAAPLVVAFYRMAFSALILTVPLLGRPQPLGRRERRLSMLSGLCLAVHFGAWFYSLDLTSISSSTVLVSTHPFLVLLGAYFMWAERPGRGAVLGVMLALLGTALIGWGDFELGGSAILGDLLALLGAAAMAGYLLIGRLVRQRVGAALYSATAYGTAAALLLAGAVAAGDPLSGFPPTTWVVFLALAIVPTLLGHTLFNWVLRFVSPSLVSVSTLGEPIGATILAGLIWGEWPGLLGLTGGLILLTGIGLFQRSTVSQ